MKLAIAMTANSMKPFLACTFILFVVTCSGCATNYSSSCETLAKNQKGKIKKMVKRFEKSASGRHVILLETGSGQSDLCRTHFLDQDQFKSLPDSAEEFCWEQERTSDTYCTIYSVDGVYSGERVE